MKFEKRQILKDKITDTSKLGFGKYFTDYMFIMNYSKDKGWHDHRIVPNEPFKLDPSTTVLHYAQGIFEGMKAFIGAENEIRLFRPMENFLRMNRSADRMCIPNFDVNEAMEGLKELLKVEKDWIPTAPGTALYIRPTIIGSEEALGVHASLNYIFFIILSPVGAYYSKGLAPVSIYVEDFYTRAGIGGTGEAKCIGNYAGSLKGAEKAKEKGFDQVLWLDAHDKKYCEEVGSMNMFFVIDDEVLTPKLTGSILPGITRDSVIRILKKKGVKITERLISIDEIEEMAKCGRLKEVFGTGTAAVISPVGLLHYKGQNFEINNGKMGEITSMLYNEVTGIQTGKLKDEMNFVEIMK